ncbi:phosphoenolpyruvate carboxylase [Niabella pedocola]|uniref:Phosphoenolpyruvate carboxylase n=1 Tax=Niabella pedocola TaxID=1752077 RepID=A0ABS8PWE1_9BACT|nr:phosphoenolpyruvate carboxylase [Niabella pedocola]MCD2425230.1 phosphoenolpyruvate carboxylase [Niabella pedocola]
MDVVSSQSVQHFKNDVGIRFQLYNSLFTSLPFNRIEKTGILLSLLSSMCEEGYEKALSPVEIVDDFFNRHTSYSEVKTQVDLLFRLVQYIERQVVLFDALEDASYKEINDLNGTGTLKQLMSEVVQNNREEGFEQVLKDFCVRLVLTAHPTQFYPGSVLGIIRDLSSALIRNDASEINMLLQQLGKTPFLKKKKPTPYDEAVSLIWYLENVFYPAAGRIISALKNQFPQIDTGKHALVKMGFWPGGDRDGNPFVTTDTTLQVAGALRGAILKCYYMDVRRLRRRLTFQGVEEELAGLEQQLYDEVFVPGYESKIQTQEIIGTLEAVRDVVNEKHNGLFVTKIQNLINKIEIFGLHFASLDIRQDSSIHEKLYAQLAASGILPANYNALTEKQKVALLLELQQADVTALVKDDVVKDTVQVVDAVCAIQKANGEEGCNRYIISHCTSVLNIIEVVGLFRLSGIGGEDFKVDVVPLFETIEDLQNAGAIMKDLYSIPSYKEHLNRRGKTQTIMLGFSDGTKDGGYLMANWSIYRAKEELTRITRQYGFDVIFFDGRGGPPSRGGGKTHKFYASMGSHISNKEIQLTIQGQTVSANFGIIESAQFNLEQLINAGVSNSLFTDRYPPLSGKKEELMQELASYGFDAYKQLKEHPQLANYLYEMSPLRFYNETNIGSRPAKRGGSQSSFSLNDLRAIPFAGAWSQLKQNVPGFYGVGTALKKMEYIGRFEELKSLYKESLYFKTLLDNCEMAMSKSYFPITAYMEKDEQFGGIWKMIYDEYILTKEYLYKLSGHDTLMASYPVDKLSIRMRERIVKPLVTIQQYALVKLREGGDDLDEALRDAYGKLVMRCSFGIINAGRNSA